MEKPQAYYCIRHGNKELKTSEELKKWYLNNLNEIRKKKPDFDELPLLEQERNEINSVLANFMPDDNDSQIFKGELIRYLSTFLNGRLLAARSKNEEPEDELPDHVNSFFSKLELLTDFELKQKFIEEEIKRTEKTSLKWLASIKDLPEKKRLSNSFKSGQDYLEYLKKMQEMFSTIDSIYHYYDLFLWSPYNKKEKHPYQIDFRGTRSSIGKIPIPYYPDANTLLVMFLNKVVETSKFSPNEIEGFLNYHFYKYKGEKQHWLRYTKIRIKARLEETKLKDELDIILKWFQSKEEQLAEEKRVVNRKSKLDFTKDKLRQTLLELANLSSNEKPSTYLNDLLEDVRSFKSFEFECDFFLNVHYLCNESADKFWSESHRKDISEWLGQARVLFKDQPTWPVNIKKGNKTPKKVKSSEGENFSQRQIAIAYCIMNIHIDSSNAETILRKHSTTNSVSKLLQKRFNKPSELTKISENKTSDSKHLKDLEAAKRLISGMKNKEALKQIDSVITAFHTAYKTKH